MSPITIKPSFYLAGIQPEVANSYRKKDFSCYSKKVQANVRIQLHLHSFMMPFLVHLVLSIAPCVPVNHEAFALNICTWQSSRLQTRSEDNNRPECARCVVLDVMSIHMAFTPKLLIT